MQPSLSHWANFYVILGSAAAALIGLQFIVITLIASLRRVAPAMREINAFATPNIILFSFALIISATMTAPWVGVWQPGWCCVVLGCVGFANGVAGFWHASKSSYKPDWEDWIWYSILPIIEHICLIGAGVLLIRNSEWVLPGVAFLTIAFLFTAIHNAWDTVTYVATRPEKEST